MYHEPAQDKKAENSTITLYTAIPGHFSDRRMAFLVLSAQLLSARISPYLYWNVSIALCTAPR